MYHDADEAVRCEFSRPTVYCDIAITEEGEMRLENFDAAALQRVLQRRFRPAQVFRIKVARMIEHFGVTDRDGRSGRALRFQAHPADQVLSEIHNRFARGSL